MKTGKIKEALGIMVVGASLMGSPLVGAPLDESHIAKDAKWLAHVDVEALMESTLGDFFVGQLKQAVAEHNKSAVSVDVDRVLAEIHSITAYGDEIGDAAEADGVLIFRTGDKLPAIIDGFLAHESLMEEENIGFEELEDKPFRTILFDNELFLSYPEEGLIMASKRFEDIESAYAVFENEAPNLDPDKNELVMNADGGFFLIASATGLAQLENMPPQARILQKTKGGQISLGEDDGEFRANVMLATAGADVSQKVYHILKGFVALASFTTVEDENMADLVNRIDVSQSASYVAVDFRYPTETLLRLVGQVMEKQQGADSDSGDEAQRDDWNDNGEPASGGHSWKPGRSARGFPAHLLAASVIGSLICNE